MKRDIYIRITDKIVASLERGVRPWCQPWSAGPKGLIVRPLRSTGQPYNGINVLSLWMAASDAGYSSPSWITYKQAKELGAHVRKGERGSLVVYANTITKTETDASGEETEHTIPFMKGYTVFNAEQVDGLPDRFYAKPELRGEPIERIDRAETFFAKTGAVIGHGGGRAFYMPSEDRVQMPPFETFRDAESYYGTLAHECTHWTRHERRLDRDFGRKRYGDEGYAMEELVAELGSAFIAADLGLEQEPREDHAAYIECWLKVLKSDKRAIFSAASHAQKAADFLHGLQAEQRITA